ncbi:serine hydrolase domain-containing protein [Streptomyces albofaciens]|uniref:serine hydrolase domain-containing protein n=1 Tax=Streptomyces albofaciens TaxID=66866 RepID=UPI00142EBFB1|nr:serine hydrolase domain-containing protein [Streptomyces albofaciens]
MDARRLGEILGELAHRHRISVAQCAVRGPGGISVARAGHHDAAGAGGAAESVRLPFASVTKLFTAAVALQLVTDGDLDLDEPVRARLSPWADAASGVTLRHLLSHCSGLVCDAPGEPGSAAQAATATAAAGLLFPPGSAFSYSNAGFTVVGRLIETVTGMSWRQAVTDFLLGPLDIAPAFLGGGPGSGTVRGGHVVTRNGPVPVAPAVPRAVEPAAALAGRVEDLVAFGGLFLDDRGGAARALLDDEAVAAMRQPPFDAVPFGLADAWGLGWALYGTAADRWLGLDAAGAGTACHLRVHPASGTVLAFQADSAAGAAAWDDLAALLRAEGPAVGMPPAGVTAPGTDAGADRALPDCTGRWVNGETVYRISRTAAGTAVLEDDDGTEYFLSGHGVQVFSARPAEKPDTEHLGRFLTDPESGRTTLMQFGGRLMQRAA